MAATKFSFKPVRDARGHKIRGVLERNGRYYASICDPGNPNARKVPLVDETNQAVQTAAQAVLARNKLVQDRQEGKTPGPRIAPPFDKYCHLYLDNLKTAAAKSPLTIARERSALNHCIKHFGSTRLSAITAANIESYVLERKREGVHSRSLNLHIVALRNLFQYAKRQGWLKHDLPTRDLQQLPYQAPKRTLCATETIDALCAEATRTAIEPTAALILRIQQQPEYRKPGGAINWQKAWCAHPEWQAQLGANTEEGRQALYSHANYLATHAEAAQPQPVYAQGQMLADWIRLMQYSGARRTAALHAKWEQVDWQNRQLHLHTKRGKEVVVDFNPKLEAHLKAMQTRRILTPQGGLTPFLFPSPRSEGCLLNFQKTLNTVRTQAHLPGFNPHDLRHYFISMCVMEGFDFMTIAEWAGHSDGGVLIGKVYGHLSPGHKQTLAQRLTFGVKPEALADSKRLVGDLSVADLLTLVRGMKPGAPPT